MNEDRVNVEELFPGGKWETPDEYSMACPYCGDAKTHTHFFINVRKKVFHCFLCSESGSLRKLMHDQAALMATAQVRYSPIQPKEQVAPVEKTEFECFRPLADRSPESDVPLRAKALEYLHNRGITDIEIFMYNIRYAATGRYAGRVIIPIREAGATVCFSARAFVPGIEPKYLFPRRGETLLSTSESIFNYDSLEAAALIPQTIVITEGIYDAIAVERMRREGVVGVSTLSKTISNLQARKLSRVRTNRRFVIMFDSLEKDNAIMKDIHKAANKLTKFAVDIDVRVAMLKSGDPDTSTPDDIIKAIETAEDCRDESVLQRIRFMDTPRKIHYPLGAL